MPEIAECGNAREDNTMENAEMPEYNGAEYNTMEKPKCQKRQHNGEAEMPKKTIQCGSYAKHVSIAGSLESQFNPWKCKKSLKWKKRKAI